MSAEQIESVESENRGLAGTRQRVDPPSRPLERIYESLDFESRDRFTELYESGQTIGATGTGASVRQTQL